MTRDDIEQASHEPLTPSEVKTLRNRLGWTQERFGAAIGGALQEHVSRAENGAGLHGAQAKLARLLVSDTFDE